MTEKHRKDERVSSNETTPNEVTQESEEFENLNFSNSIAIAVSGILLILVIFILVRFGGV